MKRNIQVTRATIPDYAEYIYEIKDIWDTHWLTNMGTKHQQLKEELIDYLSVSNLELLVNGHLALELSIQAMGLNNYQYEPLVSIFLDTPRREIITTPFTFASTTHAIVRNGLFPVFCDIDPNDYTIDANKIERLITKNTVAILPVHVYGNICNVSKIKEIADKHGLKVIYDAAHAFGESVDGIGIGAFGDASCFSFHATKVFNTIEGGAVSFKDEVFGRNLYLLKNFGIRDEELVNCIGANAKMNEFCASMGICNLRHIDDEINKRKVVSDKYDELLDGIEGITIRRRQPGVKSNYAYYPILIDERKYGKNRDELYVALKAAGIHTRKYFYPLTSCYDCYSGLLDSSNTPVALKISKQVLTLPMYADLSLSDVERICNLIVKH